MKKLLIIASFILVVAPIMAQNTGPNLQEMIGGKDYEIVRIGDSLWRFEKEGKFQGYGTPVDETLLLAKLNNRTRSAGICFLSSRLLNIGTIGVELYNYTKKGEPLKSLHIVAGALGVASICLDFAGCVMLVNNKVYLTPEGVIVKLNKPENKKQR